jgi:hypothetical protein
MSTTAPSRTHSQSRPEPDVLAGAGELVGWAPRVGAAALCVADGWPADDAWALGLGDELALGLGDGLALGLSVTLTLGLGKLPTAFLTVLPHPAAMHPVARIAAERTRLPLNRDMPGPFAYPLFGGLVATPYRT